MTQEQLEAFKNMTRYEVVKKYTKMWMNGQIKKEQYQKALAFHDRLQSTEPSHNWTNEEVQWITSEFKKTYEDQGQSETHTPEISLD